VAERRIRTLVAVVKDSQLSSRNYFLQALGAKNCHNLALASRGSQLARTTSNYPNKPSANELRDTQEAFLKAVVAAELSAELSPWPSSHKSPELVGVFRRICQHVALSKERASSCSDLTRALNEPTKSKIRGQLLVTLGFRYPFSANSVFDCWWRQGDSSP